MSSEPTNATPPSDLPQAAVPAPSAADQITDPSANLTAHSSAHPSDNLAPDEPEPVPSFGWNAYAERLNGRFAMVGFAALLITQLFTRQDFWTWIGL